VIAARGGRASAAALHGQDARCYGPSCRIKEVTTMSEMTAAQKDKLMADLKVVIADAEELLRLTAGEVSAGTGDVRMRLQERLATAKDGLLKLQESATEKAKAAGRAADDYVHDHPWKSVGIAAGIGLVVGMLIGRR